MWCSGSGASGFMSKNSSLGRGSPPPPVRRPLGSYSPLVKQRISNSYRSGHPTSRERWTHLGASVCRTEVREFLGDQTHDEVGFGTGQASVSRARSATAGTATG